MMYEFDGHKTDAIVGSWGIETPSLPSSVSGSLAVPVRCDLFRPLISQSATVEQRNDDANYRQNGQHIDNDHAVTALYIRIEIANLPPDLLVRKALFVRRFFMLNIVPHVESPRPSKSRGGASVDS